MRVDLIFYKIAKTSPLKRPASFFALPFFTFVIKVKFIDKYPVWLYYSNILTHIIIFVNKKLQIKLFFQIY